MKQICVFCGSSMGKSPEFSLAAQTLGQILVERGITLVYGGGKVGMMGLLADTMLAKGGKVIGVIPRHLMEREVGHRGVTELRVVETMHERKAIMAELSEGFIALPGGYGTLEEIAEVLTWAQLGLHHKPCGLLNVGGYFDHVLAFLDRATDEKFIHPGHRAMVISGTDSGVLLDQFDQYQPPKVDKAAFALNRL